MEATGHITWICVQMKFCIRLGLIYKQVKPENCKLEITDKTLLISLHVDVAIAIILVHHLN